MVSASNRLVKSTAIVTAAVGLGMLINQSLPQQSAINLAGNIIFMPGAFVGYFVGNGGENPTGGFVSAWIVNSFFYWVLWFALKNRKNATLKI